MFEDRYQAGVLLADKINFFLKNDFSNTYIIAIPRGGVITGKAISDKLNVELSAIVVKKIGTPSNPELAIGAIGPKNTVVWDEKIIKILNLSKDELQVLENKKKQELKEKEKILDIKFPNVKGKDIVLVDDGVATGATAITASSVLKKMKAKKIILAVPVIAETTFERIKAYFDEIIYILKPVSFYAVGEFYKKFNQVSDEEAKEILTSKG